LLRARVSAEPQHHSLLLSENHRVMTKTAKAMMSARLTTAVLINILPMARPCCLVASMQQPSFSFRTGT
jgi:hypothetical protein